MMKNIVPLSQGGAGLQFVKLPNLPEVTTAQHAGQYFKVSPKRIVGAINRNFHLFELWARRATDQETENLKTQDASFKRSSRRANPMLITFEGALLLATCMKNPEATEALINWAKATNRIRQQQSLVLQEQIENDTPLEQIAETLMEPKKPREPRPKMGRYEQTPLTEGGVTKVMEETGTSMKGARDFMMAYAALHVENVIAHIKYGADHIDDIIEEYKQIRH